MKIDNKSDTEYCHLFHPSQHCHKSCYYHFLLSHGLTMYQNIWFKLLFYLNSLLFCINVCEPVHHVETIHDLCYLLTAAGNLLRIMRDARKTVSSWKSFLKYGSCICHISEKVLPSFPKQLGQSKPNLM